MIDQTINLLILELFDNFKQEPIYIEYINAEKKLMSNIEIMRSLNEYHSYAEQLTNINYTPFVKDIANRQLEIEKKLKANKDYGYYEECYTQVNARLQVISEIIFTDIVEISRGKCTGNCYAHL